MWQNNYAIKTCNYNPYGCKWIDPSISLYTIIMVAQKPYDHIFSVF